MTVVYSAKSRCPGGQKDPTETITYLKKVLGKCVECDGWFRLYTNGKVVMHKRQARGYIPT